MSNDSARHISEQLAVLQRAVGRIEGNVESIKNSLSRGTVKLDKHDERISKLEHNGSRNAGFSAGVGAVFGAALGVIGGKLGLPWPTPGGSP